MARSLVRETASALFCVMGLALAVFSQEPIKGRWQGEMVREGARLPVTFDFAVETAGLTARFNSPTQRAIGVPLRNVRFAVPKIHFELVGDSTTIVFDGELSKDSISGQFVENEAKGTFALQRATVEKPAFREKEVTFANAGTTLAGTILRPLTRGPHPAVLFLHGSGPEARYSSRFLAEYLATRGIAALIYDKRGVGKSSGDWKVSDFSDLASDAIAGINLLKTFKNIDPKKIGIYGHSQGGMIAPLVASRSKDVAFVLSGAGSAVPLHESEVNSLTNQIRAQGIAGDELSDATRFIGLLVEQLRTGNDRVQFEAESARVRKTKWYPMLQVPPKEHWFWPFYKRIADYNSANYWEKVTVPALVIYGERDVLVAVDNSVQNIDRALNKAGNRDYTILLLPRASHSFNIESEPGRPFEWQRLSPGFPDLIAAWVGQRVK